MNNVSDTPVPHDSATVGPYHLVSVLGEGGFGVVYLAERREPYVQAVALKVLKAGMDSPSLVARFELERQALALMDHPNVARVIDGGLTPPGSRLGTSRPYFVMELVAGRPINDFCRENRLDIEQRLRLFIPVCEAVQHAHTKGVVHRDLKPSNILVMRGEAAEGLGEPTPKVIDFGVAKALSGSSLHHETMTGVGNFIGTPEYMSPEQAAGGGAAADLDTRTDVYSLGVVLYELLTGALPFDRDELWKHDVLGMMRIIREIEPPKPSTRVAGMSEEGGPGAGLPRRLRGDLDWIVMRAMDKSRERRYQSPGAFAADITRYLRTEPVEAGPPSRAYRVSKFVRRNKVIVGAAALAVGALVVGLGVALVQRQRAVSAQLVERAERSRAEASSRFILHSIETIRLMANIESYSLIDFVDFMATQVDSPAQKLSPQDRATTRTQLGDIYTALQLPEKAEEQLTAAIKLIEGEQVSSSLSMARASVYLAKLLASTGRNPEATELLDRITPELRAGTLEDIRALVPTALTSRGLVLYRAGRHTQAEEPLQEAIRLLGEPDSDQSAQAVCDARSILAQVLCEVPGRRREALRVASETVHIADEWVMKNPAVRITALNTLGRVQRDCGDTDDAIETYSRALELARESPSIPRMTVAGVQITLAQALRDVGRIEEAQRYAEAALETRRQSEPDSLRVADALDVAAGLAADRNDLAAAEEMYREQLRIARLPAVRNEPAAAGAMTSLADVLVRREKFDEALALAEQARGIRSRTLAAGHWKLQSTTSVVGSALAGVNRCDEAETMLRTAAEALSADSAAPPRVVRRALERLIGALERCGKGDAAAPWRERLRKFTNPDL